MENEINRSIPKVVDANKQHAHQQMEDNLNAQILEVTMEIRNDYPELCNYLEEMPNIPNEKDPIISLEHLHSYLDSLTLLVSNYKHDHPKSKS